MHSYIQKKRYLFILNSIGIFLLFILVIYNINTSNSDKFHGVGSLNNPMQINTLEDYKYFTESVNSGNTFKNQYISLNTDIDYRNVNLPIGNSLFGFEGIFDGNGHKIRNLNIDTPNSPAGLFLNLGGIVCNLEIESGLIAGSYAGAIAGSVNGEAKIYNCLNKATIVGASRDGIAGDFLGELLNCVSIDTQHETITLSYHENNDTPARIRSFTLDELQDTASFLNNHLDAISTLKGYHHWYSWFIDSQNTLCLSDTPSTVLCSMRTECVLQSNSLYIDAYNGKDGKWYLPLPSGIKEQPLNIQLTYSNGQIAYTELNPDKKNINFTYNNTDYNIEKIVGTGLPTLFVDTGSSNTYLSLSKDNILSGAISALSQDGQVEYTGSVKEFNTRGNDSWTHSSKKGYNLVLKEDIDLLGLGSNRDYVLLSGSRNNSLLTYKLTFDIEKALAIPYAPEAQFINLYVNHAYQGMFLLTEKVEVDKNRIDISNVGLETKNTILNKLYSYEQKSCPYGDYEIGRVWYDLPKNPSDITGGYLLEINKEDYSLEQSRFNTLNHNTFVIRNAKYASSEELNYIADYWQDFEDGLYSDNGYNNKGIYYTNYIDLTSFADQWLHFELNSEGSVSGSVYYYKTSDVTGDGLIHASYIWDVEHSMDPEESQILFLPVKKKECMHNYWGTLYSHDDFAQEVLNEWNTKFLPVILFVLQEDRELEYNGLHPLSYYQDEYSIAAAMNETRWEECNWNDKVSSINEFLSKKVTFLNKVLPLYSSEYESYYVKDGYLYGCFYDKHSEEKEAYPIAPYVE